MILKYALDSDAYQPVKAHKEDAGIDLRTPYGFEIHAGQCLTIDTKVRFQIPNGYCGLIVPKSGLMVRDNIDTHGLIDSGYSGTVRVELFKRNGGVKIFRAGDKIAQMMIVPVPHVKLEEVKAIESGERGERGFGSSGH